jgi:hypothetical protein
MYTRTYHLNKNDNILFDKQEKHGTLFNKPLLIEVGATTPTISDVVINDVGMNGNNASQYNIIILAT